MNPYTSRAISASLKATLVSFCATLPTNPTVYFTRPPRSTTLPLPYIVIHPLGTAGADGSVTDQADVAGLWQVMAVGQLAEQAEDLADDVRSYLVMRTLSITGRSCEAIQLDSSQPVTVDEDVQPPLFYGTDSYRIATTSA